VNTTSSDSLFSFRKAELQHQILEALEIKDYERLSLLEFQWAHLYGVSTLPKDLLVESFPVADLSFSQDSLHIKEDTLDSIIDDSDCSNILRRLEGKNKTTHFPNVVNINDENSQISSEKELIIPPPPPRPSLNRLRRWLPDGIEKLPKAS